MAATVSIKEVNGANTGTPTTITAARFCTTDSYNPGATYPLVVPSTGTNYSYVKTFYLNADTAPSNGINNVKWFTDGTIGWTGVSIQAGTTSSYTQATGTQGTTATQMTGLTGQADASTLVSGAPLGCSVVNTGIAAVTGRASDFVCLQAVVTTSAVAGTLGAETITFRYDET